MVATGYREIGSSIRISFTTLNIIVASLIKYTKITTSATANVILNIRLLTIKLVSWHEMWIFVNL